MADSVDVVVSLCMFHLVHDYDELDEENGQHNITGECRTQSSR